MSNIKILNENVDLDVWLKKTGLHIVASRSCEGYSAQFEELKTGYENIISRNINEAVRDFLNNIRGRKIFYSTNLVVPSFDSESIIKAMDSAEHIS